MTAIHLVVAHAGYLPLLSGRDVTPVGTRRAVLSWQPT